MTTELGRKATGFRYPDDPFADKFIGMKSPDSMRFEPVCWEIPQIESHDHLTPAMDGGREHMPVIGIREIELVNERFVASDQRIRHGSSHELPGAGKCGRVQVGTVFEKIAYPFLVDRVRPSGTKKPGAGELQKKITQRRWVEHAGIVADRETRHASITKPKLLSLSCQFIKGLVTIRHCPFPVLHDILKKDAAVVAHLAKTDLSLFE